MTASHMYKLFYFNKHEFLLHTLLCIVLLWGPMLGMLPSINDEYHTACILFACVYSATVLLAHGAFGKIYLLITAILLECVNICELGWLTMNGSVLMGDSLWVVFDTNQEEAMGFLTTVPAVTYWVVLSQLACTIATLCAIMLRRRQTDRIFSYINIVFIAVLIVCSMTPFVRHKCPYVNFYTSYRLYIKDKKEVAEFFRNRKNAIIDASCYHNDINKTIVIIIGESASRHHLGLYGYPRSTTPRLDSIANELVIYTDVTSPARATLVCMKQILSFANYMQPDMYKKEASIIDILKGTGYKTYWIDNQGANGRDDQIPSSYRTIASTSDYYHVIPNQTYDENILPLYDQCLNDTASNKAVFIHLIGSHFPYDKFVPDKYKLYTDTIGIISPYKDQLKKEDVEAINKYDNSIAYNDYIIYTFVERLKSITGACAMLYLSDHGEEMYETYPFGGRSKEKLSRSQCDIPFILWRNDEYTQHISLDIDTARSFCSDDAIYAIMDMAGVSYALKDTTKSIFSSMYEPKQRKVEGIWYEDLPTWR